VATVLYAADFLQTHTFSQRFEVSRVNPSEPNRAARNKRKQFGVQSEPSYPPLLEKRDKPIDVRFNKRRNDQDERRGNHLEGCIVSLIPRAGTLLSLRDGCGCALSRLREKIVAFPKRFRCTFLGPEQHERFVRGFAGMCRNDGAPALPGRLGSASSLRCLSSLLRRQGDLRCSAPTSLHASRLRTDMQPVGLRNALSSPSMVSRSHHRGRRRRASARSLRRAADLPYSSPFATAATRLLADAIMPRQVRIS